MAELWRAPADFLLLDNEANLIPVDGDLSLEKNLLGANLLSVKSVLNILLDFRADKVLPIIVILDCFRSKASEKSFYVTIEEPNITILCSFAEETESVFGGDISPFTRILLENLDKGWTLSEINNAMVKEFASLGIKQVRALNIYLLPLIWTLISFFADTFDLRIPLSTVQILHCGNTGTPSVISACHRWPFTRPS